MKTLTGSDAWAALVSLCLFVPTLLAPLAGVVADRAPRRRFLILVNLGAGFWLLPLLLVRDVHDVWLIFVVMLGYGLVLVLISPAEMALFTELVPPDERGSLNGLRLTLQEGAKLLAPLVGAGLFALLGGGLVAALDAATFLVAALLITAIRLPAAPQGTTSLEPWRTRLMAGLHHLKSVPGLGRLVLVASAAVAVSGLGVAAQYDLVDALGRPPAFLGVLTSLLGAGSIAAGLLSGQVLRRQDERQLALLGLAAGVVGYGLIATGWLPLVATGWLVRGLSLPWLVVAAVTATQRLTVDALQGRVAGVVTLLLFAGQPLSQVTGAALVGAVGYRTLYISAAALAALLIIWLPARGHLPGSCRRRPRRAPLPRAHRTGGEELRRGPPIGRSRAGSRPSPTPDCAPPSSTGSRSAAIPSRPEPTPTGSRPPTTAD